MDTGIAVGRGGWVRITDLGADAKVYVRYELRDGRLEPAELWTADVDMTDRLSLARFHGAVNGPELREHVQKDLAHQTDVHSEIERWRRVEKTKTVRFASKLGATVDGKIEGAHETSGKRPDEWYGLLGTIYQQLLVQGEQRPAAAIARANDVPLRRVHRWITEARRRGLMAPARRQGRAG